MCHDPSLKSDRQCEIFIDFVCQYYKYYANLIKNTEITNQCVKFNTLIESTNNMLTKRDCQILMRDEDCPLKNHNGVCVEFKNLINKYIVIDNTDAIIKLHDVTQLSNKQIMLCVTGKLTENENDNDENYLNITNDIEKTFDAKQDIYKDENILNSLILGVKNLFDKEENIRKRKENIWRVFKKCVSEFNEHNNIKKPIIVQFDDDDYWVELRYTHPDIY